MHVLLFLTTCVRFGWSLRALSTQFRSYRAFQVEQYYISTCLTEREVDYTHLRQNVSQLYFYTQLKRIIFWFINFLNLNIQNMATWDYSSRCNN